MGFLETLAAGFAAGLLGGLLTFLAQERRLRREFETDDAALVVVKKLLSDKHYELRSFNVLRSHIGGYERDELEKLLVRAGAIRFFGHASVPMWGLLSRNEHRLTKGWRQPDLRDDADEY